MTEATEQSGTTERGSAAAGVHFIGMGGVGMSGLARILLARGVPVSGSDARESAVLADLRQRGAQAHVGHAAAQLDGVGTVVVSSAIRATNPELERAHRDGLRVVHRSEMLAELMQSRDAVAIAGTHGKTTTTSMTVVALRHCGADPSYAIGGEITGAAADIASAHEGSGRAFVAEADESDGSFLRYQPLVAVITNIEPDHLDHYGTAEAVRAAFAAFASRIRPGGFLIACADDPWAGELAEQVRAERSDLTVITYGESGDVRITEVSSDGVGIRGYLRGHLPGSFADQEVSEELALAVPGNHNLANATAAWCVARALGIDSESAAQGLATFGGTRRRFELIGRHDQIEIRDDYAHHPTEVAAALHAARSAASRRLVVLFQPHLYSRTRIFAEEFAQALALADLVLVLEVYGAREDPEPGVSARLISDRVPLPAGQVELVSDLDAAVRRLVELLEPGDLVVTMGAGDVTGVGPRLLQALAGGSP